MSEAQAGAALGVGGRLVFIDRDLLDEFQADAIEQQAQLVKQDLARDRGPYPTTRRVPPPPVPDPVPSVQPPPPLQDLLTSAGLGDVAGTVGSAVGGAASALGSAVRSVVPQPLSPPPLGDLLQTAGLGPPAPAATYVQGHYGSVDEIPPTSEVEDRFSRLQDAVNGFGLPSGQPASPAAPDAGADPIAAAAAQIGGGIAELVRHPSGLLLAQQAWASRCRGRRLLRQPKACRYARTSVTSLRLRSRLSPSP
jgi:hypothetical protein